MVKKRRMKRRREDRVSNKKDSIDYEEEVIGIRNE
jgi:hypothetical protein